MTAAEPSSSSVTQGAPQTAALAWFVGRDGLQYGPVGDGEFRSMLGQGQILPTDLVWREGFADWQPAASLRLDPLPQPAAPPRPTPPFGLGPSAQQPGAAARQDHPMRAAPETSPAVRRKQARGRREEGSFGRRTRKVGRGLAWAAIAIFFILTLGAAYLVFTSDKTLMRAASVWIPNFGERVLTTAPIAGFGTTSDATDQALQKAHLWQVLKKYHPNWYAERVKEATDGIRAGKPEAEVLGVLMQGVVKLRRQYAGDAASAPISRLKSITTLFASNLVRLRSQSVDACFQYVSAGESAPAVVALLQNPDYTSGLQAQLAATFEGIEEGRRTPRVYPQPKASDYDELVAALEARGWSKDDLTLFADSQKLAKAPPDTVCRLVTEWFEAQLAIKEADVQLRLLADSLRPVVAG